MNWYDLLIIFTLISAGNIVLTAVRAKPSPDKGRAILNLAILGLMFATGALFGPPIGAMVGGGLMIAQILAIRLGARWLERLRRQGHDDRADRVESQLRLLLGKQAGGPTILMGAIETLRTDGPDAAAAQLERRARLDGPDSRLALAVAARIRGDTPGLLALMEQYRDAGQFDEYEQYPLVYLRTLAEVRGVDAMFQAWPQLAEHLRQTRPSIQTRARLLALAAAGDARRVDTFLSNPKDMATSPEEATLMRAAAWQAAGHYDQAHALLQDAASAADPGSLQEHLCYLRQRQPMPQVQRPLDADREDQLTQWATDCALFRRYLLRQGAVRSSPVTLGFLVIVSVLALFTLTRFGVPFEETLYRAGALFMRVDPSLPPLPRIMDAVDGQLWRVITTNFLHGGWMHFALNSLALAYFGVYAERFLGTLRTLVLYTVTGISGTGMVLLLNTLVWKPEVSGVVGASCALMGAVGAGLVICFRGWQQLNTPLAYRQLRWLASIVALQSAIDLAIPQISFTGHLFGLLSGITVTLILHRPALPHIPPPSTGALESQTQGALPLDPAGD